MFSKNMLVAILLLLTPSSAPCSDNSYYSRREQLINCSDLVVLQTGLNDIAQEEGGLRGCLVGYLIFNVATVINSKDVCLDLKGICIAAGSLGFLGYSIYGWHKWKTRFINRGVQHEHDFILNRVSLLDSINCQKKMYEGFFLGFGAVTLWYAYSKGLNIVHTRRFFNK